MLKAKAENEVKRMPRTIWVRDFSLDTLKDFTEQLINLQNEDPEKPVLIMIASGGGDVDGLLGMVSVLELMPFEIRTCAIGIAASAGAVLLSCGTKGKRYIFSHSRVMIHQIWTITGGNADDIKNEQEEMDRLNEETLGILAENCGISLPDLMEKLRSEGAREHYLSSQDAVDLDIVDAILESFNELIPESDVAPPPEESESIPPKTPVEPEASNE